MAEKILNTRIQLKYATLAEWNASTLILKAGEVAFATVPTAEGSTLEPVMFKVGDGSKTFAQLDWASAKAADVYGWAKAAGLPVDATKAPEGKFVEGFAWENNKLVPKFRGFITEINEANKNKLDAPTTKAVKDYVDTKTSDIIAQKTVVAEGTKIDVTKSDNTYTVSHEAVDAPTETAGSGRKYLTGVTTDGYGHITGYTTATEEDQDLSNYKTKQTAVEKTGEANKTLQISQDTNGKITVTPVDIAITANQVTDFATTAKAIKVDNATHADAAAKVDNKLTVGTKTFDGSAAVEVTAADLGLESAMHFIGALSAAPETAKPGDVYLNTATKKEYVYDTTNGWVELGDEGSYALRTVTITGTDGLTGGGDLTSNRTIGIADNGVTTGKIADGNVTKAKLEQTVQDTLDSVAGKQDQFATLTKNEMVGIAGVEIRAASQIKLTTPVVTFGSTESLTDVDIHGSNFTFNGKDVAIKDDIKNGQFTVSGTGALTGSGSMTANQASDTSATLDLTEAVKGQINGAVQTVTAGIGIKAVKTGTNVNLEIVGKDETDEDGNTVTWIFDCGGAN